MSDTVAYLQLLQADCDLQQFKPTIFSQVLISKKILRLLKFLCWKYFYYFGMQQLHEKPKDYENILHDNSKRNVVSVFKFCLLLKWKKMLSVQGDIYEYVRIS